MEQMGEQARTQIWMWNPLAHLLTRAHLFVNDVQFIKVMTNNR